MSSLTRQAIIDCTISLAEQKPIKKITVNDIVKGCGITRNTFYYYYHDIYDVLDQMLVSQIEELREKNVGNYDKFLFDLIEHASMYKKLWRNLYKSMGHENLQQYVQKKVHYLFKEGIENQVGEGALSDTDMEILCAFYEEAIFGVLARWLRGDATISTREELHDFTERLRVLFNGVLPLMVSNARESKQQ